jgi:hypothetical protein
VEGIQFVIGSKDFLLNPDIIKVCLHKAYFESVCNTTQARTEQTEKKVVHRVDDDLFNQIEVGKTRELAVAGSVLLDKVFASGGCGESTMLLAGPPTKRYRQADR